MSGNAIESLSLYDDECIASHLVVLDASRNRLSAIAPSDLPQSPYLNVVYLDDNQLETVAVDTFMRTPNLGELHMHNNQLRSIEHLPRALRSLFIDGNRLSVMPTSVVNARYLERCALLQLSA